MEAIPAEDIEIGGMFENLFFRMMHNNFHLFSFRELCSNLYTIDNI